CHPGCSMTSRHTGSPSKTGGLHDCLLHGDRFRCVETDERTVGGDSYRAEGGGWNALGSIRCRERTWWSQVRFIPTRRAASDTFPAVFRRSWVRKRRSTAWAAAAAATAFAALSSALVVGVTSASLAIT